MRVTKTSLFGVELITHYESFMANAYKCQAGTWTIGFGTTRYPDGRKVQPGDKISRPTAVALFQKQLPIYERIVDDCTRDDITQPQFDALVSLCYNAGTAIKSSSLVAYVNAGLSDKERIAMKFLAWDKVHVNGKLVESEGLKYRRMAEARLFNTGELFFYSKQHPL